MDGKAFDELTRITASGASRRATLGMIASAALTAGLAKFDLTDAKKKHKKKGKKKGKNKKKPCKKPFQDCGGKKKCCKGLSCIDGSCGCPTGQVPSDGRCMNPEPPECDDDNDCASNEICQNGACVPEPPECTDNSDCDSDEICEDGECVAAPECTENSDCGDNELCQDGGCFCPEVLEDRCVIRCDPDADCPGACSCRGLFPGTGQPRVVCIDDSALCSANSCDSSDDCDADEICSFADCGSGGNGRCFRICTPDDE